MRMPDSGHFGETLFEASALAIVEAFFVDSFRRMGGVGLYVPDPSFAAVRASHASQPFLSLAE